MRMHLVWLLAWGAAWSARTDAGDRWPQFRGDGTGHADVALPTTWDAATHIAWKTKIPGLGWSQPVVWGDRIFVTTAAAAEDQPTPDPRNWGAGVSPFTALLGGEPPPPDVIYDWKLLCLDGVTGDLLWERTARHGRPAHHIHPNNSYASETPATDGEVLIASFGMSGVYGYDLEGTLLWSFEPGALPIQYGWGTGSSPILAGDQVIIQFDNDKSSLIVALDRKSGEERWRTPRDERSNWSTPYLWRNRLRTELVAAGGRKMRAYEPVTGELLWEMQGSGRTATTPLGDENLLYVDSYDRLMGRRGVLAAIRPGAHGDISLSGKETTGEFVAWSTTLSGYRSASPLLAGGCLYVVEQQSAILRCFDAATGTLHFRERIPDATGMTASPIAANGLAYFLDQEGRTSVLKIGPQLERTASNDLGEMCWSSPAVLGNKLLLRSVEHLYCITP